MQATRNIGHIQIQRGQAIVLVGPQGSGKNLLARQIAEAFGGTYEEITSRGALNAVLLREPTTVIVDESLTCHRAFMHEVKELIRQEQTTVRGMPGKGVQTVRTPNFIVCTGDKNWLRETGDRRFHVVPL